MFSTDGRLGFFFPDVSPDTVHSLFTTDPSSGIVQGGGEELSITDTNPSSGIKQGGGEGGGGELFINDIDPSSGMVQGGGEGEGGKPFIPDTDTSSGIVQGSITVDPSPDTFSVILSSDPTYIMILITSLSIFFPPNL